jgi:GAF domain-containing protein
MPEHYLPLLAEASTLDRIAQVVRSAARRVAEADGATFVLRDGEFCFYADEDAIAPLWKGQRFPMTDCISGWAMLNAEVAAVPDIEQDARIPLVAYRPTFVRSLVMVPISRTAPVGAIGAYWQHIGPQSEQRINALLALADAAAETIDRVGLDGAPWAPNFRLTRTATDGNLPVA